ncbi:hypothetical protein IIB79_06645 [candidate division KSB1 bacterium]|nr:hypothetical protein [candidate division KSB1 bacterium]
MPETAPSAAVADEPVVDRDEPGLIDLIEDATAEEISARVELLMSDSDLFERMSRESTKAANEYTTYAATRKWNAILDLDRRKA